LITLKEAIKEHSLVLYPDIEKNRILSEDELVFEEDSLDDDSI